MKIKINKVTIIATLTAIVLSVICILAGMPPINAILLGFVLVLACDLIDDVLTSSND
jgi:hypothetical protein